LGIILAFEISSTTFIPGEVTTSAWLRPLPIFWVKVTVKKPLPTGRQAFRLENQAVKGDGARIESRSPMLDARVSSFERRTSIQASTTINVKHHT
jgi:hypothetical protein